MAASMKHLSVLARSHQLAANHSLFNLKKIESVLSVCYQQARDINKHYHPEFKRQRREKFLKVPLPDFSAMRKLLKNQMAPAEIRAFIKQNGILPYRPPSPTVSLGDSGQIIDPYTPKEGDGVSSTIGDMTKSVTKKGVKWKGLRDIRKLDPDFDVDSFPELAQQLYVDMHKLLIKVFPKSPNKDTEDDEWELHQLVTEHGWPLVTGGLENKTLVWQMVESLEPARIVHVTSQESKKPDNRYGQITVRFHTKQIMALYDRFGRLMLGSPSVPKDVLDFVIFEKHLSDTYGKWRVHGKIIPSWKTTSYEYPKTVVLPELPTPKTQNMKKSDHQDGEVGEHNVGVSSDNSPPTSNKQLLA